MSGSNSFVVTCYDLDGIGAVAQQKIKDAFDLDVGSSKATMLAGPNDLLEIILSPENWKIVALILSPIWAGFAGKAGSDFWDYIKSGKDNLTQKSPSITTEQIDGVKKFLDFLTSLPEEYTVTFGLPLDNMAYMGRHPGIELKEKNLEEILRVAECLKNTGEDLIKKIKDFEEQEYSYLIGPPWNSDASPTIKIGEDCSLSVKFKFTDDQGLTQETVIHSDAKKTS